MKNKIYALIFVFIGMLILTVSCSNSNDDSIPSHKHLFTSAWSIDENNHWHECRCGEKRNIENHSYGEWTIVEAATETETGLKKNNCLVCNYEITEIIPSKGHDHNFSTKWSSDENEHWNECACGDKQNINAHTFGEWIYIKEATQTSNGLNNRKCNICNYIEKKTIEKHTHDFSNNICKICGFDYSFSYESISNDSCKITSYNGDISAKKIIIPSKINGYDVFEIDSAILSKCNLIEELYIPFVGEKYITSSSQNNKHGFGYLFGTDNTANTIEVRQEYKINQDKSESYVSYYIPLSLKKVFINNGYVSNESFINCNSIEEIVLSNVTSIGQAVFKNCKNLKNIYLPQNLISIGVDSFLGCEGLTGIYFDGNLENWFNVSVTINDAYTVNDINTDDTVKSYSFYYKDKMDYENPSSEYKYFEAKDIVLPESITIISSFQTYFMRNINSLKMSDNVKIIDDFAFYNCKSIQDISFSNNIVYVGYLAFYGCENLEFIEYNSCKYLSYDDNPYYVLIECNQEDAKEIEKIDVNFNTKLISTGAFAKCVNLKSITLPFVGSNLSDANDILYQYPLGYIFGDSNLIEYLKLNENVEFNTDNSELINLMNPINQIYYEDNYTYYKNSTYYFPSNLEKVIVIDGCINFGVFSNCETIVEIELGGNGTFIGKEAFYNCSRLEILNIPNSIKDIGDFAFIGCSNLSSIVLPNNLSSIGKNIFEGCSHLKYNVYNDGNYVGTSINPYLIFISVNRNEITSIDIHNDTKYIYEKAFYNNEYLENVNLTNSIIDIGYRAFYGCSKLKAINIPSNIKDLTDLFYGCVSLEAVTFDENSGITNISYCAFYNCISLKTIILPETVTEISNYAFYGCSNLESIVIPYNLKKIGENTFKKCIKLKSIYCNYSNPIEDIEIESGNDFFISSIYYYYSSEEPSIEGNYWYFDNGNIVTWDKKENI